MQCKAHDALTIVLREHKGRLESFEQDDRGRLLLADLIGRRVGRMEYIKKVGWENSIRPAVEKLRKLVPEYVQAEMRKGPLDSHYWTGDVLDAFKNTIFDKLTASTFERLGQAQRLISDYYALILMGYPVGPKPTREAAQRVNFLHLPDRVRPASDRPHSTRRG